MNILILGGSDGSISQIRPEYEMYLGFKDRGHQISIVIKPDSLYLPRLKELGVKLLYCYPAKKFDWNTIRTLRHELKSNHYDIVLANSSKTIPNAAFAAAGSPAKLVLYRGTTGGAYWHDPINYLTILNPRADGIVCVSEAVRQYLLPKFAHRRTKLTTIYKGHDIAWYKNPPADLSEFGITENDFVIACVANARPHKGLRYLLEATKSLSHINNIHVMLVGRNIQIEPYVSLIESSNMTERIHITGFRHDAPEIIAACKTLVLPSLREGLPRVVMESMGYGIPPIVTNSGGCAEVVEDGVSGYIVPIKDPESISDRIIRLYENPQLIQSMSAECRKKMETDLSLQSTVDQYISFFDGLLKNNSAASP